jgi:hypothetical protein
MHETSAKRFLSSLKHILNRLGAIIVAYYCGVLETHLQISVLIVEEAFYVDNVDIDDSFHKKRV